MAYMTQEHKKEIDALLKEFMPKSWKYSLSVKGEQLIILTIKKADVDLIGLNKLLSGQDTSKINSIPINHYHLSKAYDGEVLETLEKITEILNYKNYNNSNVQADHVDVGHFVHLQIGNSNSPFQVVEPSKPKSAAKVKM